MKHIPGVDPELVPRKMGTVVLVLRGHVPFSKVLWSTNYREVYFDEPCWVQRCVFYSVWFYAVSKPLFWVMCIFVDVIFVSQEMHCKKGTGYFRRSRICLSIQ